MFTDITVVEECVSLVITKVNDPDKTSNSFRNKLNKNIVDSVNSSKNEKIEEKEKLKTLIGYLSKSVHLIYKPTSVGVWDYAKNNLLKQIESETKYSQIDQSKVSVSISPGSINLCKEFFEKSREELMNVLRIVASKIIKEAAFINAEDNIIKTKVLVQKPRNYKWNVDYLNFKGDKFEYQFEDEITYKKILNLDDICKFVQIMLDIKTQSSIEVLMKNVDDMFDILISRSPDSEIQSLKSEKDDIHEKIHAVIYLGKVCPGAEIKLEELYQIFDVATKTTFEAAKKGIGCFVPTSDQNKNYYEVAKFLFNRFLEDQNKKTFQLSICDYHIGNFFKSQKKYKDALLNYLEALKKNPEGTSIEPIFLHINDLIIIDQTNLKSVEANQKLNQQLFDSNKRSFEESIRSLHIFLEEKCKRNAGYVKYYDKIENHFKDIQFLFDLKDLYLHFKSLVALKISESKEKMEEIFHKIKDVFVRDSVDQKMEELNQIIIKQKNEMFCLFSFNKNLGGVKSTIIDEWKNLFIPSVDLSSKTLINSIENLSINNNILDQLYFDKIIDLCKLVNESSIVDQKIAVAYVNKGRIFKDAPTPDHQTAVTFYEESLNFDKSSIEARKIIAELYYKMGSFLKSAEFYEICYNFQKVIECYKNELTRAKDNIHHIYEKFGDYFLGKGMEDKAIEQYYYALSFCSEDKNYIQKILNKIALAGDQKRSDMISKRLKDLSNPASVDKLFPSKGANKATPKLII